MAIPSENVTTKDIVLGLDTKVDALVIGLARLEGAMLPQGLQVADHETRIRALERFRFAIPSSAALSIVLAALALGLTFIH